MPRKPTRGREPNVATKFERLASRVHRVLWSWLSSAAPNGHHHTAPILGPLQLQALRQMRPALTPENAAAALFKVLGLPRLDRSVSLADIMAANRWVAGVDALRFALPPLPHAPPDAAALQLIDGLLALDDALAEARRDALLAMPA